MDSVETLNSKFKEPTSSAFLKPQKLENYFQIQRVKTESIQQMLMNGIYVWWETWSSQDFHATCNLEEAEMVKWLCGQFWGLPSDSVWTTLGVTVAECTHLGLGVTRWQTYLWAASRTPWQPEQQKGVSSRAEFSSTTWRLSQWWEGRGSAQAACLISWG